LGSEKLKRYDIILTTRGTIGKVAYFDDDIHFQDIRINSGMLIFRTADKLYSKYIYKIFQSNLIQKQFKFLSSGVSQPQLPIKDLINLKIPLPPKDIQEKIVKEIEKLEKLENSNNTEIKKYKDIIHQVLISENTDLKKLGEVCEMKAGIFVSASDINDRIDTNTYPCFGGNGLRGYTKTFTHKGIFSLIGRQGALCGNIHKVSGEFHATEHAIVVTSFDNIDKDWLDYQLRELNLNQYSTGVAQPGLSVTNLKKVSISVPSIKEQKEIVNKIETIEKKIKIKEQKLINIPQRKEEVLNRYLK